MLLHPALIQDTYARERVNAGDFVPVGGYQGLGARIADKERKIREEYEKQRNKVKEEV